MNENQIPQQVLDKMYHKDGFSQWLGIEQIKISEGHCVLRMQVRSEMLNGFDVAHGGITYSLADSAFAFACNSYNRLSVSIETSISHNRAVRAGDILTAFADMMTQSNKIGTYQVIIKNQLDEIVAIFKGTCYRTEKILIE